MAPRERLQFFSHAARTNSIGQREQKTDVPHAHHSAGAAVPDGPACTSPPPCIVPPRLARPPRAPNPALPALPKSSPSRAARAARRDHNEGGPHERGRRRRPPRALAAVSPGSRALDQDRAPAGGRRAAWLPRIGSRLKLLGPFRCQTTAMQRVTNSTEPGTSRNSTGGTPD
eukprot:635274-Prymnesium_polylepis.1